MKASRYLTSVGLIYLIASSNISAHNNDALSTEGGAVCTITCPNEITVDLAPGECSAEVTYSVTATMCTGSIIQTSGLPSGSEFPIGVTQNCFQIQSASCCFDVIVNEFPNPTTTLACNDNVQVSVNENCEALVSTDMILEGGPYSCYNDYLVAIQSYGSGFGGVTVTSDAVGQTLSVTVTDPVTGNTCFGTITVEDKLPPIINCPPTVNFIACDMAHPIFTGYATAVDNCTNAPLITYSGEDVTDICPGIGSGIFRTWTATDESGNYAQCVQQIGERCQAHHIFFNEVTSTSISFEWTNGNGDYRIVEISTSPAFYLPENGLTYSFDTEYQGSNQQIIYVGTGDNVTVTNLSPNKTYWFHVFEAYCYESSPTYYLIDVIGNPKSQITNNDGIPPSIVPNSIPSPVPCVNIPGSPGLYQSNLPEKLFNGMCTDKFPCKPETEFIWNQVVSPEYEDEDNYCELIPFASDCFRKKILKNNWEFRQRGFITDPGGSPCMSCGNIFRCGGRKTHSSLSCWDKDDRYAWDINLADSDQDDCGIFVYSIFNGDACKVGSSAIMIRHINNGDYWYSWYDNIDINSDLSLPSCTGSTTNFKPCDQNNLKYVPANTKIGDINNSAAHLHFGVYDEVNCELVSRNKPIVPNYFDINGDPYDVTEIEGQCTGSIVSNATVNFKKGNKWFFGDKTDENGRFNFITIPGLNEGDSLKLSASGYLPVFYRINTSEEDLLSMNIPLIDNPTTLIKNPNVTNLSNTAFSKIPSLQLKITGENYFTYDVVQVMHFEDTTIFFPITLNVSYVDSIYNLIFQDTGKLNIGVIFRGINEEMVEREYIFNPDISNSFYLVLISDVKYFGANVFVNNKFIKQLDSQIDSIELLFGEHSVEIVKNGFNPIRHYVNNEDNEINVNLIPNEQTLMGYSDTVLYDFVTDGTVLHRRNVTLIDTSQSLILNLKQSYPDFTHLSLVSKSREFRFSNTVFPTWATFSFASLLDQIDPVCPDSVYLLRILDDSLYSKRYFSANNSNETYDSAFQKLFLKENNFGSGQARKEAIVLMAKQAPESIQIDTIVIAAGDSIKIPFSSFFVDPDSIANDMLFSFEPINFINIYQEQDSFIVFANKCYNGTLQLVVSATHDELIAYDTLIIDILTGSIPKIDIIGDNLICTNDSVSLSINTDNSILWSTGDTSQLISIYTPGVYFAFLYNEFGCIDTTEAVNIDEAPQPSPVINASTNSICEGDSLLLSVDPYASYSWSNGDTSQQIIVTNGGEYSVFVVDSNGCVGSAQPIFISVWELPFVNLGRDTAVSTNQYELDAGPNAFSYQWNTGDTSQVLLVTSSGEYSVTVTDSNGCQVSDTIKVEFITGTFSFNELHGIHLYPNPNQGIFHLEFNLRNSEKIRYEIFDPMGRLTVSDLIESERGDVNTILSIPKAIPGVYILKLRIGSYSHFVKLVVF